LGRGGTDPVGERFWHTDQAQAEELGWPQTELATRSGTGECFIVDLESGKPSCQLEKAVIVARSVGLELGDLRQVSLGAEPTTSDNDLGFLPTFGDGE